MELVFNELSTSPLSANNALADQQILDFIGTFKEARALGFRRIRFEKYFHDIEIAIGYTVQEWVNTSTKRTQKDLLLAAVKRPFISDTDGDEIDEFLEHSFDFEKPTQNGAVKVPCQGLAVAHIYDEISISFSNSAIWKNSLISIIKTNASTQESRTVAVLNIFSAGCIAKPLIQKYIEDFSEVVLIESNLVPSQKKIHFRPDHGTDTLTLFANRLLNSPYVIGVINSLAWKPQEVRFIKNTFSDGVIHLRLYWDDRGLGVAIQTTGRNTKETREIARILEREYV